MIHSFENNIKKNLGICTYLVDYIGLDKVITELIKKINLDFDYISIEAIDNINEIAKNKNYTIVKLNKESKLILLINDKKLFLDVNDNKIEINEYTRIETNILTSNIFAITLMQSLYIYFNYIHTQEIAILEQDCFDIEFYKFIIDIVKILKLANLIKNSEVKLVENLNEADADNFLYN